MIAALTEPVNVNTLFLATWGGCTIHGRMRVEPDGQLLRVVALERFEVPDTMREGLGMKGRYIPTSAFFHINPHQVRMMGEL